MLEITKAVFPNNRAPVDECFLRIGLEHTPIIRERDLYDFEFKIIGITIASGSFTYHANTDITGFDSDGGQLMFSVITSTRFMFSQ